jgi:hypothetical protein
MRSVNSRCKSKCILLPKQNSVTGQKIGKHSLRCTIKSLKLSAEIYPYRDFRVCGWFQYFTVNGLMLPALVHYPHCSKIGTTDWIYTKVNIL